MTDYQIIASGSSGNCVRVGDMLFDIGVPISKVRPMLYEIRYLLLTHRHSDHIHMRTLKSIKKSFPRLQVIANFDVAMRFPVDHVVGDDTTLHLKDRTIRSFPCVHDVPTHGYVIERDGQRIIYATDTSSLEHAPEGKYDAFFIESNHDEVKIEQVRNMARKRYGYDAWAGAMRHLSTQKSKAFYYIHRRSKESPWVELHKSERFY